MTPTSRCLSCPQITTFVRDHCPEIGKTAALSGVIIVTMYNPSYGAAAFSAIAATSVFATIAKYMRGPSPLCGRVVDRFAELPAEDRANPQNLIRVYERLEIPGKPRFAATTPPLQRALEIWKWMHGPGREAISALDTELDLSTMRLTALPRVIGLFHNIPRLNLSRNQLATLPPEITQLTALRSLELCRNEFTIFPEEITQLLSLQHLDLTENRLDDLPLEIGAFSALKWLSFSDNQLTAIPSEIGRLTTLETLLLSDNQLDTLPQEIGELTALHQLFLGRNRLTTLPQEIGQLTSLQLLYINQNLLTALPSTITQLIALDTIYLRNNPLTAFPRELNQLPALQNHDLNENPQPPSLTLEENLRSAAEVFIDTFPTHLRENAKYYKGARVFDFRDLTSIDPDKLDRFSKFLPRIPEIADFANPKTRKNVILRIDRMIQLACKNLEFRQEMLQILEAVETGCGMNRSRACEDRILTLFNEIEIAWQFHHNEELSHAERRDLALREGRYKWIEEIGKKMAEERGLKDEIETVLRLQLELKKRGFDLPISTTFMSYPNASGVDEAIIQETIAKLKAKNPLQLLSKSEHWLKHQAEQYPDEAARIQEEYAHLDAMASEYYKADDQQAKANILKENPRLVTLLETLERTYRHHAGLANAIMKSRLEAIANIGEAVSRPKVFEAKVE